MYYSIWLSYYMLWYPSMDMQAFIFKRTLFDEIELLHVNS